VKSFNKRLIIIHLNYASLINIGCSLWCENSQKKIILTPENSQIKTILIKKLIEMLNSVFEALVKYNNKEILYQYLRI
jgi:hypothetical protein